MNEEEFRKGTKSGKTKSGNIALRDFHLFMPPTYDIEIKEGDDLNKLDLPENLIENLKTEKVMKG